MATTVQTPQDLVGQVLDNRYRIDGILGEGGMGMVYKAVQTSVQRPVAVKTLKPELAMAPAFFERFKREAEIASRLHHPNIITIYDFGRTQDGTCYFVMEFLQGESLRERVKRAGPMTLREATQCIEQAAVGLGHAHKQNVVHRDIKPHNIMLANVDGSEYVKVLDFGLVKAMEVEEEEQLTSTGQVLGTPQYMPPEQAGGDVVDQRSDLYSLTGVFYFCLTGTSPYGANNVRRALQASLTEKVPAIGTHRQGAAVPEAIDAFIEQGLQPEKNDRFQTMDDFLNALQAAIAGVPDSVMDAVPKNVPEAQQGKGAKPVGKAPSGGSAVRRTGGGKSAVSRQASSIKGVKAISGDSSRVQQAESRSVLPWVIVGLLVVTAVGGVVASKLLKIDPAPVPVEPHVDTKVVEPAADVPFKVTLSTSPTGAEVLEDGVVVGNTPFSTTWARGARRTLAFKLKGYQDIEKTLKLDSQQDLSFTLEPVHTGNTTVKRPGKKPDDVNTFE